MLINDGFFLFCSFYQLTELEFYYSYSLAMLRITIMWYSCFSLNVCINLLPYMQMGTETTFPHNIRNTGTVAQAQTEQNSEYIITEIPTDFSVQGRESVGIVHGYCKCCLGIV